MKLKGKNHSYLPISDLTKEERNINDAIIFFNIKDKILFGTSQCLAEAFLSFSDIPNYSPKQKQIHLTLTRLQNHGELFYF